MERVRIKDWKQVRLKTGPLRKCYRLLTHKNDLKVPLIAACDGILLGFGFDDRMEQWVERWRLKVASGHPDRFTSFLTKFGEKQVLVTSSDSGLGFFSLPQDNSEPHPLPARANFGEFFVANHVLLENFYPHNEILGVMATSQSKIVFYGVNTTNLEISMEQLGRTVKNEIHPSSQFWSQKLSGTEYNSIFVRTSVGIDSFFFDEDYNLNKRFSFGRLGAHTSCESIRFEDFGDTKTTMVHTNASGLFIYNLAASGAEISGTIGSSYCDREYIFTRVNSSGNQFLSTSSSNGLEMYPAVKIGQTSTMDITNLPLNILYAIPVGIFEGSASSKMVLQDTNNNLLVTLLEMYEDVVWKFITEDNYKEIAIANSSDEMNKNNVKLVKLNTGIDDSSIPHLSWSSQNDVQFLKNAVNELTGQVEFKVPLIDAPVYMGNTLQNNLYYSSDTDVAKICGVGFDLNLPTNFIQVDRRGSIFEEDFAYYIIGDQGRVEIYRKGNSNSFKVIDGDLIISYEKSSERWIVDSPERTLEFGGSNAVQWTFGWQNWAGAGTDFTKMIRFPLTWYLVKAIEKKYGPNFTYSYKQINEKLSFGSPEYTYSTNLVKIQAGSNFAITFNYEIKESVEYNKFKPPVDEPFTLPPFFENNVFLRAVTYVGIEFKQQFQFNYEVTNGKRFLKSVSQSLSPENEILLAFEYKIGVEKVSSIKTCIGANYEYEYEQLRLPELQPSNKTTFGIISKPAYATGKGFKVFAYADLRFTNKLIVDVVEGSAAITVAKFDHLQDMSVEIVTDENNFSVSLITTVYTDIHFFVKSEIGWLFNNEKSQRIHGGTKVLQIFQNGIAIRAANELQLKYWDDERQIWGTSSKSLSNVEFHAASSNLLTALTSNMELIMFYQKNGYWRAVKTTLNVIPTKTNIKELLEKFNFKDGELNILRETFEKLSLQMEGNTIMITQLSIADDHILAKFMLYAVNANHQIIYKTSRTIHDIDILNLKQVQSTEATDKNPEKTKYVFKHVIVDGRYAVRITDIDSNWFRKAADRKTPLQEVNEAYSKEFQIINFIDWNKLMFYLDKSGVHCDGKFFFFTGDTFQEREKNFSLTGRIGNKIVILEDQIDPKNLKIVSDLNGGQKTYTFSAGSKFLNAFPQYLAYQEDSNVSLLSLNKQGEVEEKVSIRAAELIGGNSTHLEVLSRSDQFSFDYEFVQTPIFALLPLAKKATVAKETVKLSGSDRVRNYQRKCVSSNSILVDKFWDNSENVNGREEILLTASNTLRPHVKRNFYNCRGELEKTEMNEEGANTKTWNDKKLSSIEPGKTSKLDVESVTELQPFSTEKSLASNQNQVKTDSEKSEYVNGSTIYDRTGNKVITKLAPYSINEQEVSFYGFENYEDNLSEWKFLTTNVKSLDSLTGRNCLHLSRGENMVRIFKPNFQQGIYVVSSWMQFDNELQVGDVVRELSARILFGQSVELMKLNAVVEKKVDNWFYVELFLYFEVLRDAYASYLEQQLPITKNLPSAVKVEFSFEIVIIPAQNGDSLKVDNIRFSPIDLDFEANIFDERTGRLMHILKGNGEIESKVYNRGGQEIASLNEKSELEWYAVEHSMQHKKEYKKELVSVSFESASYIALKGASIAGLSIDEPEQFYIQQGQLKHSASKEGKILMKDLNLNSYVFRFDFILHGSGARMKIHFSDYEIEIVQKFQYATVSLKDKFIKNTASFGEILFIRESCRVSVLIDGENVFDRKCHNCLIEPSLIFTKTVTISNIMKLKNVSITIEYFDELQEKNQIVKLVSEDEVHILENLYDNIGRPAITTKLTRVPISPQQQLFTFSEHFVEDEDSVWIEGKLKGLVDLHNSEDEGFPYSRTTFKCSPLNVESAIGQPGQEYSVSGNFHKVKNFYINIPMISNLYPKEKGFRYEITKMPNDSLLVYVYDEQKNKVAKYVHVQGYDKKLSTYHYDNQKNLVKVLSPNFNDEAKVWETWETDKDINTLERQHGLFFEYAENENVLKKISPDTGIQEFYYDESGRKTFEAFINTSGNITEVIFYKYDSAGNLIRTGTLLVTDNEERSHETFNKSIYVDNFQEFYYNDDDNIPEKRSNKKKIKTPFRWDTPEIHGNIIEALEFNNDGEIVSKNVEVAASDLDLTDAFEIKMSNYDRRCGKYRVFSYPLSSGKQFYLYHTYDRLGNLIGLGSHSETYKYFRFQYNTFGNLVEETHLGGTAKNQFTRHFIYNSPGYLTKIKDIFLEETLEYTSGGYGQSGFGDGIVMSTIFKAHWVDNFNPHSFKFSLEDERKVGEEKCLKALQGIEVLSEEMGINRMVREEDWLLMPYVCMGSVKNTIEDLIAKKIKSHQYGYRYRYGGHQELLNAKYILEHNHDVEPLTLKVLSNITKKPEERANIPIIWESLVKERIVITDTKTGDLSKAIAKPVNILETLPHTKNSSKFIDKLRQLLVKNFFTNTTVNDGIIYDMFQVWSQCTGEPNHCTERIRKSAIEDATNAIKILKENNYLKAQIVSLKLFKPNLLKILEMASSSVWSILKLLYDHLNTALLTHPFDFEAFDSDLNGNHKHFYSGFNRYTLSYHEGSNKIAKIHLTDFTLKGIPKKVFDFGHDERGNVVQAMHKNIRRIEYHPVSQRTTEIFLDDGRFVRFAYDAAGERIFKMVFNKDGYLSSRKLYVRDEKARVLVDVKTEFFNNPRRKKVTETIYLYSPRGLVGFIRNGSFYSVITDHAGSVRLVVKEKRVVASYDFSPYGEIQKSFVSDPESKIDYLFTGQEFDEETVLYNYHARLYDPSIGRFYQPDPKAQYLNPYLYGGNSPVSLVDPDGEFFFLLTAVIGCAIAGAYFSGAAVSNEWNPGKWNWESGELWGALVGGAIGGALIPFTAPAAFVGLGVAKSVLLVSFSAGVAYINTAAVSGKWDPSTWDWSSPKTINGLITGFTSGLSLASGFKVAHTTGVQYVNQILKFRHAGKIFLGVSYGVGVGVAYTKVSLSKGNWDVLKWDWSSPGTWAGLVDGFDSGFGWPQNFMELGRGISKVALKIKVHKLMKTSFNTRGFFKNLKQMDSLISNPLFKTSSSVLMASLMVSSANAFSGEWSNDFATYESLLNGVFFGKDVRNLIKTSELSKTTSRAKKLSDNNLYENYMKGKNLDMTDANVKTILSNYLLDASDLLDAPQKTHLEKTLDEFLSGKINQIDVIDVFRANDIGNKFTKKLSILNSDLDPDMTQRRHFYPDERKPFMSCGRSRRQVSQYELEKSTWKTYLPDISKIASLERNPINKDDDQELPPTAENPSSTVWCRKNENSNSFWCFHGPLQLLVTPLEDECQVMKSSTPPQYLLSDSYSHCRLVGKTVFCEGQRSTVFVANDPQPNILNALTSQLMLLRVGMHALGGMWRALVGPTLPPFHKKTVNKAQICQWEKSLLKIEEMQKEADQKWAKLDIEECRQMVIDIGDTISQGDIDVLEERLQALTEDLAECLETEIHISSLMQGQFNSSPISSISTANISSKDFLSPMPNYPMIDD